MYGSPFVVTNAIACHCRRLSGWYIPMGDGLSLVFIGQMGEVRCSWFLRKSKFPTQIRLDRGGRRLGHGRLVLFLLGWVAPCSGAGLLILAWSCFCVGCG